MAINAPFFLNAADLASATAVYLDSLLTYVAPDGVYGDGTITRQQSSGLLLVAESYEPCATPCGGTVSGSGTQGVYQINLNAGDTPTSVGAIIIKFNPFSVPDGIRATYDGVVYNKLSSPLDGLHQSSNYGNFTITGDSSFDCGLNGNTTVLPSLTEYLYNDISFVATGNTQSVTILPGDVSLGTSSSQCVMIIPKTTANPNNVLIEMIGPCSSTGWDIEISCPTLLPIFNASDAFETASVPCSTPISSVYYFAKVHTAVDSFVGLYDYVFADPNGQDPLPNGFHLTNDTSISGKVIEVHDGIIVGITSCI